MLNVKDWLEADDLNRTLLKPAEFLRGYQSPSGGIEWAHGPYLSNISIAERINNQSRRAQKAGDKDA